MLSWLCVWCFQITSSRAEQFNLSWRLGCENPPENCTFEIIFQRCTRKSGVRVTLWTRIWDGPSSISAWLLFIVNWKFWWCLWVSLFPDTALSKAARLLGLRVRTLPEALIRVSCECCVFGCDHEGSTVKRLWATRCCPAWEEHLWISAGVWWIGTLTF